MPIRDVVLTARQHKLVEGLVRSGRYQNVSEVLRAGLRLVEQREQEDASKLKALRAAAEEGWADLAGRRYDDVADVGLDDFVADLGLRAADRAGTPRR